MAQAGIREYDAKKLCSQYHGHEYQGIFVDKTNLDTLVARLTTLDHQLFVVKPDQLFGKRGKHGLIGLQLDAKGVYERITDHMNTAVTIDGVTDTLDSFLVEPYIAHEHEYYLSFETTRGSDVIHFSRVGGMNVEENWDRVSSVTIGVLDQLEDNAIESLIGQTGNPSASHPEDHEGSDDQDKILQAGHSDAVKTFIRGLFSFFRAYGFVYLECNPFTIINSKVEILDMVGKVDSCAHVRMRGKRDPITWTKPFGTHVDPVEEKVVAMDNQTMASMKLHILNPDGRIWMILGGGGASVILVDTLAELGFGGQIANYGELSGNPDTDSNREYSHLLLDTMLASDTQNKYLIIAGGIANFTRIDSLMVGVCDALQAYQQEILKQGITVLVRRGGLQDKEGLALIKQTCEKLGIPIQTADGNQYMTTILRAIT